MTKPGSGPEAGRPSGPPAQPRPVDPGRRREVRIVATAAVGITAMVVVWWLFMRLRSLFLLILVAFFVSLAIEPAVSALARRHWRRGMATGAVFIAVAVLSIGFAVSLGALVASQAAGMIDGIPGFLRDVTGFLDRHFGTHLSTESLHDTLTDAGSPLRQAASSLADNALSLGASTLRIVFDLLTIGLFAFFLSADGPRLRRSVCSLLPPARQRAVLRAWDLAIERTGGYLYSRALLAAASAVATGVFLTLIGLPYSIVLGLWVGVASQFIPTVGTYLAGLLPALVALANDPKDAIWLILFMLAYQQIENYVLAPPLTARSLAIHPGVAFGSVIAGAAILGPVGALLALPATATIQSFAAAYIHRYDLVAESSPDGGGHDGAHDEAGGGRDGEGDRERDRERDREPPGAG